MGLIRSLHWRGALYEKGVVFARGKCRVKSVGPGVCAHAPRRAAPRGGGAESATLRPLRQAMEEPGLGFARATAVSLFRPAATTTILAGLWLHHRPERSS